jgi:hypothetical protein
MEITVDKLNIKIETHNENLKGQLEALASYCSFFCRKLKIQKIEANIKIKLLKRIPNHEGFRCNGDMSQIKHNPKKEYLIRINSSKNWIIIINTLAHELVHVKQYLKKELEDVFERGKEIAVYCGKRQNKKEYWHQEHEIEARVLSKKLFCKLINDKIIDEI